MLRSIISLVYFVVGIVVANSHHYFTHLNAIKPIVSAILAVALWPAARAAGREPSHLIWHRSSAYVAITSMIGRLGTPAARRR